ncbi:WD repeat-containing protein 3-like [Stegodyphus dumicola]|uniref:WD repeat-containing protein 3-like n=1 Tax=Stegodyphus dumicola TaxID=202533 RepID=UPI0015AD3467|nr:WD repeat-containing protein 3-like [Stegodyphus dumicola]
MTTKQYLQFSRGPVFGIIASASGKILQVNQRNNKDDFVAVPACENILIWNLQTKEKHMVLNGEASAVTSLVTDHNHRNIAVGYADGMIRIFDLQLNNCLVSFIGHKSAVSCLAYESEGSNLASGGKVCRNIMI